MKPRLQTSLGQHLVLTPQLRQALHLLQLPVIELEAEIGGVETGPEGETRTGLEVTGTLSRKEWGMHFNAALGSGNVVVSDKVKLTLDIAAVLDAG